MRPTVEEFTQIDSSVRFAVDEWQNQIIQSEPEEAKVHQLVLNVSTSTGREDSGRFFNIYVSVGVYPNVYSRGIWPFKKYFVTYERDFQMYLIVEISAEEMADKYL